MREFFSILKQHTTRGFIPLLRMLVALSCYLPSVPLFTDTQLLPKWYLFVLGSALYVLCLALSRRRLRGKASDFDLHKWFPVLVGIGSVESLYVFAQMAFFGCNPVGEQGTFDNPAGLASAMALTIPMAVYCKYKRRVLSQRIFFGVSVLLMVVVLILTKSRTGMICLALYILVWTYVVSGRYLRRKTYRYTVLLVVTTVIAIGMIYYVSSHKQNSTSGRAFILMRSWELVMQRPFAGYGANGFDREYMHQQAYYFRSYPDSSYAMLADEVRHPLNEFIYMWVNYGLFGLLALTVLLSFPLVHRIRSKDAYSYLLSLPVVGLAVFCCFSYPLHYPLSCLVLLLSLTGVARKRLSRLMRKRSARYIVSALCCLVSFLIIYDAVYEWRWNYAYRHYYKRRDIRTVDKFEELYSHFRDNKYFLYNYAFVAYKMHDAKRAYRLMGECTKYRRGYNTELLAGDICRKLGYYDEAISHYDEASHMCPARFAPLEGLHYVYDAIGDSVNKSRIADEIATKKVKVLSSDVIRIKHSAKPTTAKDPP